MNSKELWLGIKEEIKDVERFVLGDTASSIIYDDPKMLLFILSRYKFVSKMLSGKSRVLEVGCGDAFGIPIVSNAVESVLATDIDPDTLEDNKKRLFKFENTEFKYHDFIKSSLDTLFDAAYMVDVLEHIYPHEEEIFIKNIVDSLNVDGVLLCGCPNKHAEPYASHRSKVGHVNLKNGMEMQSFFGNFFKNVFLFAMNDEVLHTGFNPMANYNWVLCVNKISK
jgi:SAM-dependent methyltransferase